MRKLNVLVIWYLQQQKVVCCCLCSLDELLGNLSSTLFMAEQQPTSWWSRTSRMTWIADVVVVGVVVVVVDVVVVVLLNLFLRSRRRGATFEAFVSRWGNIIPDIIGREKKKKKKMLLYDLFWRAIISNLYNLQRTGPKQRKKEKVRNWFSTKKEFFNVNKVLFKPGKKRKWRFLTKKIGSLAKNVSFFY